MEAKVDVRKLQILNDRINQTIDALNQVRLSVHGLGHTGIGPQGPFTYWGQQQVYPQTLGMYPGLGGPQSGIQGGFGGQQPAFQTGFGGPQQGLPFGIQHSPFQQFGNPYVNPGSTPWGVGGGLGSIPNPYLGGLSHSTPDVLEQKLIEERANDPLRITQTFPFYNM